MNPDSGTDGKSENNMRAKAAAAVPLTGILVAAALLSFIGGSTNYEPALSQQDLTGDTTPTTSITSTNATAGGGAQSSACTSTQTGEASGGETTTEAGTAGDTVTGGEMTTGGGGDATTGTMNATTTASTAEGGDRQNQSTTSQVRLHIEEACIALQAGDTQGVFMHLNLALNALGDGAEGNMTSTTTAGIETSTGGGGTTEAGTAGDEPGTTEDEPQTTGGDTTTQ